MGKRSPPPPDVESGSHPPPHYYPPPPPPSREWSPWLVPMIFIANIAIFVYSLYLNDCPSHTAPDRCILYDYLGRYSFQPLEENKLLGPSTSTLQKLGALDRKLVVENKEEWRLWSCMWLHAGAIHLLVNMLSLLFIGVRLEQDFGFLRIGILYVLAGFGGSLQSALHLRSTNLSLGASGALFGLLGAMLSELITNWTIYANKCAALTTLIVVIALNLAIGLVIPHVDSSAHIGGFIAGFLLGFVLLMRPQFGYVSRKYVPKGHDMGPRKSMFQLYQWGLLVIALIFLIGGYAYGLTELFDGKKVEKEN